LFRRFSAIIAIVVLTTLIARPSFSDDVTINLDQTTPYVDVPFTITEPVDAVISTTTGIRSETYIDSWIELWQGTTRLIFNDDGNHSATNWLASLITIPLTAGEYFIRATSFNFVASNGTQFPVGSYLLSTNLIVATPVPTPSPTVTEVIPEPSPSLTETVTPTPTPSPTETTVEPTPSPSETSSVQPSPEPSPTPSETPLQPTNPPGPESSPTVQPSPEFSPSVPVEEPQESVVPTVPNVLEQPVEDLTFIDDLSVVDEVVQLPEYFVQDDSLSLPESVQQIFESISSALESVPGGEQVLAAAQFVNNLGSEFTPEERREAQQVVLGAIIVSQLANPRRVK
jgi:hypothetical protein